MSLLSLLKIKHPILLAPMAGVSTPELAAEVSNAGGLGALGLGASSLNDAKKQIEHTQTLTGQPFQLNFFAIRQKHLMLSMPVHGLIFKPGIFSF